MTIVQRLVLIVLLVAIPIGLLQAYTVRQEWKEQRAEIGQMALRTAVRAAAEHQRISDGAQQLLTALSQIPAVQEGVADRCNLLLRRIQAQFPIYLAIGVADPNGRVWCSSARTGLDVSDRPYFKQAVAKRQFTVGGYVVGRVWGTRSLNFSLPFEDSSGGLNGLIIAGLDLDRLAADLTRTPLPHSSRLTIVGPDRLILVDSPGGRAIGTVLPAHMQSMFNAKEPGTKEIKWVDGSDRLVGFVPAGTEPALPFLVAVGIDRDKAMAPVKARAIHDITLLAFTVSVALLLAWWFAARFVRRPIEHLTGTMRTWGNGDITARAGPLNPGSEFNELALAFDEMAEEVEAKQRRLFSTFESTSDIIIQIARDWTVTFMNERGRVRLEGYDLLGNNLWDAFPDVPETVIGKALFKAMDDRLPVTVAYELPPLGHFETYIFPDPEDGLTLFIRDVTEQHYAQERLRDLALNDTLTRLPNRAHVMEIAARKMAEGRLSAAVLIDLDAFKHINDRFGHRAGDYILQGVASRLASCLAGRGIIARLGGDEFLALLCGVPTGEISGVGHELLSCIEREPFVTGGREHMIAASAGLVQIEPNVSTSLGEVLANADLALYRAKGAGGRICHIHTLADREIYESRRQLEEELVQATALGEFELFYQPQVRLADGEIVGAEALLRWRHPRRGLLAPGEFIDILGFSRHSRTAGDWILNEACRHAAGWWRVGHRLRVGVNLFADDLRSGDLPALVERRLREHDLPAEALELELTENIALDADEGTKTTLLALRAMNVNLAFDDFGTGFASLTTLKDFPVHRLKVDRGFVTNLPHDEHDRAIVEAVFALARTLQLEVIAEGVETAEQEEYLRSRGCHEGQGFRYGKPMPLEEFTAMILARSHEHVVERFPPA